MCFRKSCWAILDGVVLLSSLHLICFRSARGRVGFGFASRWGIAIPDGGLIEASSLGTTELCGGGESERKRELDCVRRYSVPSQGVEFQIAVPSE